MGCRKDREEESIRKGPWKAEEDDVLINHVKTYGPRDWSSIRSKGLLQRTGKSCRLRWVNKLRPNLKNGCKFSLEEERLVIELQAEFGNRWAKIATYLPGRTDNDVKNFWSSRQKRLARILHTSTSASKSLKNKREIPICHDILTTEAPKFCASSAGESSSSTKAQSCSSSCIHSSEMIKMVELPDLVNPKDLIYEPCFALHELIPTERYPDMDSSSQLVFPQISQSDFTYITETQEHLARDGDLNFIDIPVFKDVFGPTDACEFGFGVQVPIGQPFFEPVGSSRNATRVKIEGPKTPDTSFDDFPTDMFDNMEPPSSPNQSSVF